MEHRSPLQRIVDDFGMRPLAAAIGVTYQSVQKYLKTQVPAEQVIPICEFAEYKFTPHDLRPDLYPNPSDGLPQHIRAAECECRAGAA